MTQPDDSCGPVSPVERAPRGFTLVEMLVVIGLITLLASLTMAVTRRFVEQSENRSTKVTLRLLEATLREWEMTADRQLRWWDVQDEADFRDLADLHGDVPDVFLLTELLEVVRRPRASRDLLAQIDPSFLHTYRAGDVSPWISYEAQYWYGEFIDQLTVLDAWDTPIYAMHPGRIWQEADRDLFGDPDEDGTIRTPNENRYGIAPGRQVVFISAGPDGHFGLPDEFPHEYGVELLDAQRDASVDNLYSVRVFVPELND
jgi:prepilin-type N-terminal cleavage/methylation domain-containing protein